MRRTKELAEKTAQDILSSSLEVFLNHGIANTTLSMIADHGRFSRGAIYWHFKDKKDIVEEMLLQSEMPSINLLSTLSKSKKKLSREDIVFILTDIFSRYTTPSSLDRKITHICLYKHNGMPEVASKLVIETEARQQCISLIATAISTPSAPLESALLKSKIAVTVWKSWIYENLQLPENRHSTQALKEVLTYILIK